MNLKHGDTVLRLKSYPIFPKRGNGEADYTVSVDGKTLPASDVRRTGGGKFPVYTYLKLDGKVFYVAADLPKGTKVEIIKDAAPAAAPVVEKRPSKKAAK
jgi:hypothetical protein